MAEVLHSISIATSRSRNWPPFAVLECLAPYVLHDFSDHNVAPHRIAPYRLRVEVPSDYDDRDDPPGLMATGYDGIYLHDFERFSNQLEGIVNGSADSAEIEGELGAFTLRLRTLNASRGFVALDGQVLSHAKMRVEEALRLSQRVLDMEGRGAYATQFAFIIERTYLYETVSQMHAVLRGLP